MSRTQMLRSLFAGAAALAVACTTYAQSTCDAAAKACATDGVAQVVSVEGDRCATSCDGAKVAIDRAALKKAGVPAMLIVVGEQTTDCPLEAFKMAEESGEAPIFVVNQNRYDDFRLAGAAYARQLETYLDTITTVNFSVNGECTKCPKEAAKLATSSGQPVNYTLASKTYECDRMAGQVARAARAAAEQVNLAILVGEKEVCCQMAADSIAAKSGQPIAYQVAGLKVPCPVMAQVARSLARVQVALNNLHRDAEAS